MINNDLVLLAEQFKRLELHAARGGREVRRVLVSIIKASNAMTVQSLLEELCENSAYLLKFLPPYAPPLNSINQVMVYLEQAVEANTDIEFVKSQLAETGDQTTSSIQNASAIVDLLMNMLPMEAVIYTHTLSETVLNTLLELNRHRKIISVFVTESRPNNDGWETARCLVENGVEVSLTIDAAMPLVIKKADCMLSGAEIINRDGSVVGKVGAFPAAVFCRMSEKPVFIIADTGKISIFNRSNLYLTPFGSEDLGVPFGSSRLKITGSYFDVTPREYIRSFVTEKGIVNPSEISSLAPVVPVSTWLQDQL
jgi:translation initiation factor 2B subunit (eIF-2B alpha/beta/delta family)